VPQIQRVGEHRDADPSDIRNTQPNSAGAWSATVGCRPRPIAPDAAHPVTVCGDGLAGVQVGPVRGKLQPADFGGDQGVFVSLRGSQRGGGVQLHQILVIETRFQYMTWR
jgi:hypothetical protein